jgi:diguanylate cyclase (GGDEF)-like protein
MQLPNVNSARTTWRVGAAAGFPLLLFAGAVLIAIASCAAAATIWRLHSDALAEAHREISNLALVLREQTARSVQAIDLVVHDLKDDIDEMKIETPEAFRQMLGTASVHQMLIERLGRLPQANAITLVAADGKLANFSRAWPTPSIDLSDRDYYRYFLHTDDPHAFISAPVENRGTGTWTIYLVRRVNSASGEFLGMVLGAVELKYFDDMFGSIDLPRHESFMLLRRDGTVLVRHPDPIVRAGQMMPATSEWHRVVAAGGGHYVSPGYFSGQERLVAVQPLRDYPLVVDVAVGAGAVLRTWRQQAMAIAGGSLLLLAYAVYLMRMVHIQFVRLQKSSVHLTRQNAELTRLSGELQHSQKDLAEKSHELQTTLQTMDQGLMMVDAAGIVVVCNGRAMQLLDLPPALMASRPTFVDVLSYQWQTNLSGREEGSFKDFVHARTVNRPRAQELRRPDGRILEVRSTPLAEGGDVRTYTDITIRKAAEDQIRYLAHHDDLTRLVNRAVFHQRLQEATAIADRSRHGLAAFYLDLDRFKQINDQHGHDAGDRVLAEAARRMRALIRSVDTAARIGGDEFAIILPFLDDPEDVARLAQRLVLQFREPFVVAGEPCAIGISIGIALFPEHGTTSEELLRHADDALYQAKHSGRGTYRIYAPETCDVRAAASG